MSVRKEARSEDNNDASKRKSRRHTIHVTNKMNADSPSTSRAIARSSKPMEAPSPPPFDWAKAAAAPSPKRNRHSVCTPKTTRDAKESLMESPKSVVQTRDGLPAFDWARARRKSRDKLRKTKSLGQLEQAPFDWKKTASFRLPPSLPQRRPPRNTGVRRSMIRTQSTDGVKSDSAPTMPLRRRGTR